MKRVFVLPIVFVIIFGLAFFNFSFATTGSFTIGGTVTGGGGGGTGGDGGSPPDTTAPTTSITSAIDGALTAVVSGGSTTVGSITINFTGSDNITPAGSLTFKCSLDGGAFSVCVSPKTYMSLALGAHSFVVKSTDGVGLEDSIGATLIWNIVALGSDVVAPTTTITSATDSGGGLVLDSGMTVSTGIIFNFNGTDNITASSSLTFQCSLDNAVFTVCASGKSYSGLTMEAHIFKVRSKDVAGNFDATPAIINWRVVTGVDTTPPSTTIDTVVDGTGNVIQNGGTTMSKDIIFNFSGTDNITLPSSLTFLCSLDGGISSVCVSGTTFTGLSVGSHTFAVKAKDSAGNLNSSDSRTWTVTSSIVGLLVLPPPGGGLPIVITTGGSGWGGVFEPVIVSTSTPLIVSTTTPLTLITNIISDAVLVLSDNITNTVSSAITNTSDFIKSPTGKTTVKIAQPVGVISGGVVVGTQVLMASSTVTSFYDLYLLILRSLGIFLGFYVGKKKPWGTVYDSVTKRPLDPAYIVVKTGDDKEVADAITDLDGRFGFFLPSGSYKITAGKTNYEFPSKILAGKTRDELYGNLYFGEKIDQTEGEVIVRNIPMDPIGFDWNEFEKNKKKLFRIYSRREKVFKFFSNIIYLAGFGLTIASVIFSPDVLSYTFLAVNILLIIYFVVVVRKKKAVQIMYGLEKDPLPYAIIKLFSPDAGNEIKTVVADYLGRFYVLVGPGQYRLRVDNKKPDSSYESVYDSSVNLPKGVVPKDIIVEKKQDNAETNL